MHRRTQYDYWDPYKDAKSGFKNRISPTYHHQNTMRRVSQDRKIRNIIVRKFSSKERKKIFGVKSVSKQKYLPKQNKPRMFVIHDEYFIEKKEDRNISPPSYFQFRNRRLEIMSDVSNPPSIIRKSPLKIMKKAPPKRQVINVPREIVINTTVTPPSSVATSVLNNFETNPDRLLENMMESKLDKVFKF